MEVVVIINSFKKKQQLKTFFSKAFIILCENNDLLQNDICIITTKIFLLLKKNGNHVFVSTFYFYLKWKFFAQHVYSVLYDVPRKIQVIHPLLKFIFVLLIFLPKQTYSEPKLNYFSMRLYTRIFIKELCKDLWSMIEPKIDATSSTND